MRNLFRFLGSLISFAATPVFGLMAILSGIQAREASEAMAQSMPGMDMGRAVALHVAGLEIGPDWSGWIGSMSLMYGLMAVFHSGCWMGLLAGKRVRAPI